MARANRPLPAANNNVYRLKVIGEIEKQVTVTTFFYQDTLPISDVAGTKFSVLADGFQAISPGVELSLLAACSADWKEDQIVIDSPTQKQLAPYVRTVSAPGTGPAGHLPTQMAASLIKRTLFSGQCGRGRWALPGVPSTWCTLSTITTLTEYLAFATAALADITSAGIVFTPILYSANGSAAFPLKDGVAALESVTLNHTLGTSRRRKLGVGI
jgi:hypothetical protein